VGYLPVQMAHGHLPFMLRASPRRCPGTLGNVLNETLLRPFTWDSKVFAACTTRTGRCRTHARLALDRDGLVFSGS
jgi:hypothetical protein